MSKAMVVSLVGVSMAKMSEAMNVCESDDWEVFSNDLIDVYIASKTKGKKNSGELTNPEVEVKEIFETGQTYFHNWSNGEKTVTVKVVNEGVEILSGSDFETKESPSLSLGHSKRRRKLVENHDVANGKFVKNYLCGSLSTAASVARGVQLSGRQVFKKNEKLDWTAIVVGAMKKLGGEAHLEEIYKKIEDLHPDRLTPHYQNTIRGTIYKSSSDSEFFQGGPDLFKRIGEGRTGRWALR